jgi:hypothetical protein
MKKYLFIYDAATDGNEIIIKVQPLYCAWGGDEFLPVVDKEYIPNKGDKLYFLPGVNIPRVKLKDLSLEYGIKTVRNIEDATHVFRGKNTRDKIVSSHWYYKIPTSALRAIIEDSECNMDDYYKENLREALEHYTEDIVIVNYADASVLRNNNVPVLRRHIQASMLGSSNTYYTIDDDHKDLFPDILSLELYDESKLLKYINGNDAATIDESMFLQISDMFESSDRDNHILAMEIMANCNYMESLLFIEMLFERYAYKMSECHTKNHVNFKSLLSFLGKNKNYMSTSIDEMTTSLINKEVFDLDKVNLIMKYYGKEIAEKGGTQYFEVKSVTLSEEAAKLLNTNYVHEIIPDFIPEGVEQVEIQEPTVYPVNEAEHEELLGEDIETALSRIERNQLKSELIAIEEELSAPQGSLDEESNNNQIEEKDDNGFEWF